MNKVWISALATASGLGLGAMPADAKVIAHFNANGAFASVVFYDETGKASLTASESRSNGAHAVNLGYSSSSCDKATGICQGIQAFGPIPAGDFHVTPNSAALATNTSANPGFSAVKWTFNGSTGAYSETPISLGFVSVSWKSSGEHTTKTIGSTTISSPVITQKSTGQSSWTDATATGDIGNIPVIGGYASIGSNSNNEITIERK